MVNNQTINAAQIAIICATKDRPDKIRNLLESVASLDSQPGQILIADGGHNLEPLVKEFAGRINISCLYCPDPGQILQRNYAHAMLHGDVRLVLHLDHVIRPTWRASSLPSRAPSMLPFHFSSGRRMMTRASS